MHRLLSLMSLATALAACGGAAPPGIVTLGEIAVSGQVEINPLLAQLRVLDPRFEACYSRAKRQDHSIQGDIALQLQGRDGKLVPRVRSNDTGSDVLAECVTDAIAGLSLVESDGTAPWDFEADWTLTFTLAGEP